MQPDLKPGIHSLPSVDYHADPCATPSLSASLAKILVTQSPAHARAAHPRLNPRYERTHEDKFDVGTVVHALLLQGLNVMEVLDFKDYKSNAAKEARKLARAAGRVPLLTHHADSVIAMVNAVAAQLARLTVRPIPLTEGQSEQTLIWTDRDVVCRARLDWLRDDYTQIHDVKTSTRVGHPVGWSNKTLYEHGCDIQAVAYIRAVEAVTGVRPEFRWVLIESVDPYVVSVVAPEPSVLAMGEARWEKALDLWKACLESDEWPGYGYDLHWAELPAYIESQWLAREARVAA